LIIYYSSDDGKVPEDPDVEGTMMIYDGINDGPVILN
jgi:hypothetical protein